MIKRILAFELTRAKANPVLVVGYALALVYITLVLVYLKRAAASIVDQAQSLRSAVEGAAGQRLEGVAGWLGGDPAARSLLLEAPPLLATFFWLTMTLAPCLVLLIAADQLATEMRHKPFRFVLPRVPRAHLFWARTLAGWLAWLPIVVILVVPAWIVLGLLEPSGSLGAETAFAARMALVLAIYALPLVALIVFCNTFMPVAFLSYIAALGVLLVVAAVATAGAWADPAFAYLDYLIPTSMKYPLMATDPVRWLGGVAGALAYTAVFGLAGHAIFRWRDL